MNSAETLDLINSIEDELPVAEWTAAGFRIWPLARERLWWHLNDTYAGARQDTLATQPTQRRLRRLTALPRGLAGNAGVRIRDRRHDVRSIDRTDAVFLGDNVSRVLIEGHWYDRICEPIIEELDGRGHTALHLEPHYLHRIPRHNRSKLIQPRLDYEWIRSRLRPVRALPEIQMSGHQDLVAYLDKRGVASSLVDPALLRRQAWVIRLVANWYRSLFAKSGARLGFVVDAGWAQMAFNLACREADIPSIELQHGVQGELNSAYGRWHQVPPDGYALLPSLFWVWSDVEAAAIETWAHMAAPWHQPVVGGNPWLNLWRSGDSAVVRAYDEIVRGLRSPDPKAVHVLVTLAYSLTGDQHLASIQRAIADSPDEWRWWIRLHPAMSPRDSARVRSRIEVDGQRVRLERPTELPLYALLRNVDLHLTINSTTVIEAEAFQVPTVATSPEAKHLFPNQMTHGWLAVASRPSTVLPALTDQRARAGALPPPEVAAPADALDFVLGRARGSV